MPYVACHDGTELVGSSFFHFPIEQRLTIECLQYVEHLGHTITHVEPFLGIFTTIPKQCLQEGQPTPDLATVKDFVRYYIYSTPGMITVRPTMSSVKNFAERLFAGLVFLKINDSSWPKLNSLVPCVHSRYLLPTQATVSQQGKHVPPVPEEQERAAPRAN